MYVPSEFYGGIMLAISVAVAVKVIVAKPTPTIEKLLAKRSKS